VDNLCHTLVGAALGEAGLKRRTRFGNAALMVASNLPDLDVLVFATSTPAVSFRRGWTHGVLAQLVLPIALTAVTVAIDRLSPRRGAEPTSGARAADVHAPRLSVPWVLLLSYIGVCSHVFLDYLNNYGVRLLAPFDWHWFYGDAIFIVDPWLWLSLGAGAWLSWKRRRTTPARGALVFATAYVVVMLLSARAARDAVIRTWEQTHGRAPRALMVGPRPITPFTRDVIVDAGDHYETGTFSWTTRRLVLDAAAVPKNANLPLVRAAAATPAMSSFLTWARFPFWSFEPVPNGTAVTVGDMRFAGFGAMRIAGNRARFAATVIVRSKGTDTH
jgi:inner membrane protein